MLAWLLRIARNAAIDHERRRRPWGGLFGLEARPDPDPTPDQVAVTTDEHRALHAHLAALPAAQRDAIALRFGAGLTAREIGLVLGKGEEATQKLISRGMARLREVYRDEHDRALEAQLTAALGRSMSVECGRRRWTPEWRRPWPDRWRGRGDG